MERMTSRDEDCVLVNGHALGCATVGEIVQMAERLAAYEDMDSKRLRPGDTVWLSKMFYTRPKKPVPVTVDAIRIDREGTTYITGRKRFCENAIGRTVFLTEKKPRRLCRKWRARRMATKRVCDRCGAEINPTSSATYVNVRSAFHEESPDIELCCSCAMQMKEWLKSSVEEDKKDGKIH